MSIKDINLVQGGTIATTGGTGLGFTPDGVTIANGIHLTDQSEGSILSRYAVTFKNRPGSLDPRTGKMGKDKKEVKITRPKLLDDGSVVFNTIRIEREVHPSSTPGAALELNDFAAQVLFCADAALYWSHGSLE